MTRKDFFPVTQCTQKEALCTSNSSVHKLQYTIASKQELAHLETMERRVGVILCEAILLQRSKEGKMKLAKCRCKSFWPGELLNLPRHSCCSQAEAFALGCAWIGWHESSCHKAWLHLDGWQLHPENYQAYKSLIALILGHTHHPVICSTDNIDLVSKRILHE